MLKLLLSLIYAFGCLVGGAWRIDTFCDFDGELQWNDFPWGCP